jgi:hypothetical protein
MALLDATPLLLPGDEKESANLISRRINFRDEFYFPTDLFRDELISRRINFATNLISRQI